MATVEWTPRARNDLEIARLFIARDSQRIAASFLTRVLQAVRRLETFPRSGRVVPEVGRDDLREIIVASYRIIYELEDDHVRIVAVHHGARRFVDPT